MTIRIIRITKQTIAKYPENILSLANEDAPIKIKASLT
jgi:hypothetical protein